MSSKRNITSKNIISFPLADGKKLVFKRQSEFVYNPDIIQGLLESDEFQKFVEQLDSHSIEKDKFKLVDAAFETIKLLKSEHDANKYKGVLLVALDFETDSITMDLIRRLYNIDTKAEDVVAYALYLAASGQASKPRLSDNTRLRWAELLIQVFYKEFVKSLKLYQKIQDKPDAKLSRFFNPSTIVQKLSDSTAFGYRLPELLQIAETSSPLEELSLAFTLKLTGPDGIKQEASVADIGYLDESVYGKIAAYDTPENANTSKTNRLTLGAYISDLSGKIKRIELPALEGHYSILSPLESMIPFIEHNDGNRVLLATNQLRSIVPLENSEIPIVTTGIESIIPRLTSGLFTIRAEDDGEIIEKGDGYIVVQYKDGRKVFYDTGARILNTGKGKYYVNMHIKTKDVFKKDQILVESDYVKQETLSLGKNVLTAFMHYKGYTYEDGIVVSESFAKQLGVTKKTFIVNIPIWKDQKIVAVNPKLLKGERFKDGEIMFRVEMLINEKQDIEEEEDEHLIEQSDSEFVSDSEISIVKEVAGRVINYRFKGNDILDFAIYLNVDINDDRVKELKPIYDKFITKYKAYVQNYTKYYSDFESRYLIPEDISKLKGFRYNDKKPIAILSFVLSKYNHASLGDKLCNRHGNKGVIAAIIPDELMPKTEYGETIHVICDPLGVVNRANIGQLYEPTVSYIAKHVYQKFVKDLKTFKETFIKFYEVLYFNSNILDKLMKSLHALSDYDFNRIYNRAKQIQSIPVIIPPFASPSSHGDDTQVAIQRLEKHFGVSTSQKLYLPEFKTYTTYPVSIGYMYWFRLEHTTDEVLHAVADAPKRALTGQAMKGKKISGGHRIGEFDSWAILAHDAPAVMKELFMLNAESSDFLDSVIPNIIQQGKATLPAELKIKSNQLLQQLLYSFHIKSQKS